MSPPPPPGQAPAGKISPLVWIVAIVGGLVFLGLVAGILLVPRLGPAAAAAQEMSALRTITTIHTAQAQYYSQFGKFAATLVQLGPPATGVPDASAADLIPAALASTGEGNGYQYILAPTPAGYTINANPKVFGTTGRRTFFSDQSLTIHQHRGPEPAGSSDPEMK